MKFQHEIANTYVDHHFMKISKEALEGAAEQVNRGAKPPLCIEHDITLPPYGKLLSAWVEPIGDGEYRLVASCETFEDTETVLSADGTVLLKQELQEDENPFATDCNVAGKTVILSYDKVNFESEEDRHEFLQEIRLASHLEFEEACQIRKALIPDPEIIIRLSEALIKFLVTRKVVEKVGDKLMDAAVEEVENFYQFLRATIPSMSKYASPRNRPITYIFKIPGTPQIELIARSADAESIISAEIAEMVAKILQQIESYQKTLSPQQVQFLLNNEGKWVFNYLLTEKGAVIGTKQSFERRNLWIERRTIELSELTSQE